MSVASLIAYRTRVLCTTHFYCLVCVVYEDDNDSAFTRRWRCTVLVELASNRAEVEASKAVAALMSATSTATSNVNSSKPTVVRPRVSLQACLEHVSD